MNRIRTNSLRNCILGLSLGASLFSAVDASASIVTFGTTSLGGVVSYSEAGFKFTGTGGSALLVNGDSSNCICVDNGTPWMGAFNSSFALADTIVMKAADGHLFNLVSFDGAESFSSSIGRIYWAAAIRVTGVLADDSVLVADFALDQISDGPGGVADFQSFTTGLTGAFKELRFSGVLGNGLDFTIDNLVATEASVPEPGSLVLVGLALFGLIARRHPTATSFRWIAAHPLTPASRAPCVPSGSAA